MARDSTLYVRQAIMALLTSSPEAVALVADRMYGEQRPPQPEWPFVAYGQPITTPFGASCLDGSSVAVAIHAYAETTGFDEETVGGAEMVARILAVVVDLLGGDQGAEVSLADTDCPFPATAYISWTGSQVVQDGSDASAFHGFATFNITVSS